MDRQAQKLTIDEKQRFEMQKEVFVLIRLIDMVEKCYQLSSDKISDEEHHSTVSRLIEKYEKIKSTIPDFNLFTFVSEYNLDDCRFGLDIIKNGLPKVQDKKPNSLVKLTSKFYQMQDALLAFEGNPKVSELRPVSEDLADLLQKAQSVLPQYNSYLKELQGYNARVFQQKAIMETLTEDEFKELSTIVEQALKNLLNATN